MLDPNIIRGAESVINSLTRTLEFRNLQRLFTAEASLGKDADLPGLASKAVAEFKRYCDAEVTRAKDIYPDAP